MESTPLSLIITLILYTAVIFALTEVFRKHKYIAAAFFVLSLLTFPLWGANRDSWFEWAKIISVLIPTAIVGFTRIARFENRTGKFWNIFHGKWVFWFFYGILFLNILEASVHDLELGNTFNAIAGFALCVTIPFAGKFWRIDKKDKGDFVVDFPKGWCLLYTTWNALFVYAAIPDEFIGALAILIAAEIYPLRGRPDLYIMARIYTLALFVLQLGVFDVLPFMDSTVLYNPLVAKWWAIINIAAGLAYAIWYFVQVKTGKHKKSFRTELTAPAGTF